MSDASDPQAGAPPVTNPAGGSGMTGGGPLMWEPPSVEDAARLFPNFEIVGLIGRGGMGAVYKARQTSLDRFVAIKLLPLEVSANKDFADRFVREARTMAKLSHSNIIDVYDFGTTSAGHLFFVMEFVAGATLHSIIHEVGLDADQALYLAGEVCAALGYAHGKGVVHRDIKPANVMVDGDSKVKVADFGLARLTNVNPEVHGLTMTGMVIGTPDYMAPEQKRGMNVDARADLYSVGVMLYEMVCREVPQGAFAMPSQRIGCDLRLDAIVQKAMQSSPERRYQSAKEMETALEAARKPMANALVPQPRIAAPHALAVAPRAGVPVAAPRGAAPVPQYAAPTAITAQVVKNRTPLYAGIAAAVVVTIVAIVMALPKSKPKLAEERTQPETSAAKEQPSANTPATKPALEEMRGGARVPPEKPKEQPEVKSDAGGTRGAPPAPEPPKEQPVANTPEMKPAPASQASPTPPPADAPQQSATAKWLTEQEPQWKAAYATEVTGAFAKAAADLRKQYLTSLDAQLAAATRTGGLLEAVACRDEKQRVENGGAPGDDDATTPASLKAMRAGFRKNLAALEADRAARANAVHARYDSVLAQNLTLLTQNQRLDEALLLKTKRDELAAAWLKPSTLPPAALTTPTTNVQLVVSSTPMKFGSGRIADATRERPFVNSLGMEFVPVPGTQVLFSRWETRVKDYAAYARVNKADDAWTKQEKDGVPVGRQPDHPVSAINWSEAKAFCEWLTNKERAEGMLPAGMRYQLPTDEEWSRAVGLAREEGATPSARQEKNKVNFPWGTEFPPRRAKVGNYADSAYHEKFPTEKWVEGYTDGFVTTSPVGSFAPNGYGLFDMGGNVWEWCEDDWGGGKRLLRGASWTSSASFILLSSHRAYFTPGPRHFDCGFRCALGASAR